MRQVPLHKLLWPYLAFLVAAIALAVMSAGAGAEARGVRGGTAQGVHAASHGGGGPRHAPTERRPTAARKRAAPNRSAQTRATPSATRRKVEAQRRTAAPTATPTSTATPTLTATPTSTTTSTSTSTTAGTTIGEIIPIAAGIAVGTAAAVTAAVIGSVVYSVPPSCVHVVRIRRQLLSMRLDLVRAAVLRLERHLRRRRRSHEASVLQRAPGICVHV